MFPFVRLPERDAQDFPPRPSHPSIHNHLIHAFISRHISSQGTSINAHSSDRHIWIHLWPVLTFKTQGPTAVSVVITHIKIAAFFWSLGAPNLYFCVSLANHSDARTSYLLNLQNNKMSQYTRFAQRKCLNLEAARGEKKPSHEEPDGETIQTFCHDGSSSVVVQQQQQHAFCRAPPHHDTYFMRKTAHRYTTGTGASMRHEWSPRQTGPDHCLPTSRLRRWSAATKVHETLLVVGESAL